MARSSRAVPKIGVGEIGAFEKRADQRRRSQEGMVEARIRQVDGAAIDGTELAIADAESDADEVRDDGGVVRTPLVPRPGATAEKLDMFGIGSHCN